MSALTTALVVAVLFLFAADRVAAQPTAPSTNKEKAGQTATAPSTETFLGLAGPQAVQFVVDATEKNKNGTVSFGWQTGEHNTQLSFSGPIDESGEAAPLSLLGLPPGASAKFGYSRLWTRGPNPLEQQQIFDLCKKHNLWPPTDDKPCNLTTIPPEDAAVYAYLQHMHDPVWLIGGDATMARAKFSYLDPATLVAASEQHQGWSASARVGRFTEELSAVVFIGAAVGLLPK